MNKLPKYPAYKDSGVEWLGEFPKHWERKKYKYIAEIQKGKMPNKIVTINDNNLPTYMSMEYLRGGEENQWVLDRTAKVINEGEILLLWDGSNAGEFIKSRKGVISSTVAQISFFNIDNSFAWYYSKFIEIELKSRTIGMGIPHVNGNELKNFYVLIPPLIEQTTITQFLDHKTALIDQAIEIKQKQIELLKERRQIIIHKAVTRGLNPDVKLKGSGVEWIGEIPEHWEIKRLKYILKSQGRIGFKGYSTSDLVEKDNGALTLGATHLDWEGRINISEPVFISWEKYYESPEIMVSKNDIIIVQRGSTCGKVALLIDDLGPTTINPSLVLLKEITEYPEYVFLGIKVVLNGILNLVSNTAIPMLTQFQINNIEIPVPTKKEQRDIVLQISNDTKKSDDAIFLKEQEIEKLKEYRATLINSAVTGKIKVC